MKKFVVMALLGTAILAGCDSSKEELQDLSSTIEDQKERIAELENNHVYIEYELTDISVDERRLNEYRLSSVVEIVIYDDDMPSGSSIGEKFLLEIDPSEQNIIDGIISVAKLKAK